MLGLAAGILRSRLHLDSGVHSLEIKAYGAGSDEMGNVVSGNINLHSTLTPTMDAK